MMPPRLLREMAVSERTARFARMIPVVLSFGAAVAIPFLGVTGARAAESVGPGDREAQVTASAAPADTTPSSVNVNIQDFSFNPVSMTVQVGTKVVWTNAGPSSHTATSNIWDTGTLRTGEASYWVFDTPGSFSYHCTIHPDMRGSVRVTAAAGMRGPGPMPMGGMYGGYSPYGMGDLPSGGDYGDHFIITQYEVYHGGPIDTTYQPYYGKGPSGSGHPPADYANRTYGINYARSYYPFSLYSSLYSGLGLYPYSSPYGYGSYSSSYQYPYSYVFNPYTYTYNPISYGYSGYPYGLYGGYGSSYSAYTPYSLYGSYGLYSPYSLYGGYGAYYGAYSPYMNPYRYSGYPYYCTFIC